jgi:hypothetical protein
VKRWIGLLGVGAVALLSCDDGLPRETAAVTRGQPSVVDSILPIAEEMRRFRTVLGPDPGRLSGGATTIDALVDRFEHALAEADTSAFADMVMTRDEFGWLYYPTSIFTAPPYELAPALVWFQIENGSSRGLGRLLDRLGGQPIDITGYTCSSEPVVQGINRVWEGCVVRFDTPDEEPRELQLFGSILERDGAFKFLSYTNGF